MQFSFELALAAFFGGALGAMIGALQAFALCGFAIVVGESYRILTHPWATLFGIDVTNDIGFGVLGPHIAFAGGAAAVAFVARDPSYSTDFSYHPAKEITKPLIGHPSAVLLGGIFGLLGYILYLGMLALPVPTDPIAAVVVLSALIHRGLFGYAILGYRNRSLRTLILSPGRAAELWLPYQSSWLRVVGIGSVMGCIGGILAFVTGSAFLAFGISAASLYILCISDVPLPVTHHLTLPGSTIVVAVIGDISQTVSAELLIVGLILATIFGSLGGICGEIAQRIAYAHAETHLDPPAVSIVVTIVVIGLLASAGIIPDSAWISLP